MTDPCRKYNNNTSCRTYKDTSLFNCKCHKFYERINDLIIPINDFDITETLGSELCQGKIF